MVVPANQRLAAICERNLSPIAPRASFDITVSESRAFVVSRIGWESNLRLKRRALLAENDHLGRIAGTVLLACRIAVIEPRLIKIVIIGRTDNLHAVMVPAEAKRVNLRLNVILRRDSIPVRPSTRAIRSVHKPSTERKKLEGNSSRSKSAVHVKDLPRDGRVARRGI